MDTTKKMAVSRMGRIRAQEHAAAAQREKWHLEANCAAIFMYLPFQIWVYCISQADICQHQKHHSFFVLFFVFLYAMHKQCGVRSVELGCAVNDRLAQNECKMQNAEC